MSALRRAARAHPAAVGGAAVLAAIALAAVLAPLLTAHDPLSMPDPVAGQRLAPSWGHPLGTDGLSRDVWSRLLHGARVSLAVGLGAATLSALLGGLVGLASGLARPALDAALMRTVDVLLALPRLVILMAVFALWEGMPVWAVLLCIASTGWFETARLVRGHVRTLRTADFVQAARALGGGPLRVARHLLPHVGATVIVSAALDVGDVILLESALAFLGLGLGPPAPTWGAMILDGRSFLFTAPWIAIAPGLALTVTVLAANLLGDGLRDALDPRRRR